MITSLAIKNYALIDDIRVNFDSGLTIITGETGAGKSILLGALALILGKRAELNSVKDSSKKCVVEAEFSFLKYKIKKVFEENNLDYDVHTIIRREILPGGKSRAFVNDSPVNLNQLQALGVHLIDIHSQHETLSLSSEDFQMEVIDAIAGNDSLMQEYVHDHKEYKGISQLLLELEAEKNNVTKELDYNTFLYEELKEANLEGQDMSDLESAYETLNNAEEIQESLAKVLQLFSEEPIGTLETAKEARTTLDKLRAYSEKFDVLWNRLNSVIIELEDVSDEVDRCASDIEADPKKLMEVNQRLQAIHKLQQKHSVATIEELRAIETELEAKIDSNFNLDARIEAAKDNLETQRLKVFEIASKLHQKREEAIPKLKEELESFLKELGLPNARFKFELTTASNFRKHGVDTLNLLFTANKGLEFGTLKKVASGGELSRIMLAVKAVLTKYKQLPTIIFDEIDTGTSGEIAHKMALIFGEMSRNMQLFSITHLPQIAAKGDFHIKVFKSDEANVTTTHLKKLNNEERIVEIAQMIGGDEISDSALAHAKELLN